jgi:hypothetical protein
MLPMWDIKPISIVGVTSLFTHAVRLEGSKVALRDVEQLCFILTLDNFPFRIALIHCLIILIVINTWQHGLYDG